MEPPSTSTVHILNRTERRIPVGALRASVVAAFPGSASIELVVAPAADVRELNLRSRGIDASTDVLSFPAPDFPGAPAGEIVVSIDDADRQAKSRGIPLRDELCYLAIHGALHLRGMDDETESDRRAMFAEMHRIGLELGLAPEPAWTSLPEGVIA